MTPADIRETGNTAWRLFTMVNVPGTGEHEPEKPEILAFVEAVAAGVEFVAQAGSGAYILKSTSAGLSDLNHVAGVYARVLLDTGSPPSGSGYYVKTGASGAGTWDFVTLDPAQIAAEMAQQSADDAAASALLLSAMIPEVPMTLGSAFTTNKIVEAAGSVSPTVYQAYVFTSGTAYEFAVTGRFSGRRVVRLVSVGGALFDTSFDVVDGVYKAAAGSATMTPLGNDYWRLAVQVVATATMSSNVQITLRDAANAAPYTGDGASGVLVPDALLTVVGSDSSLLSSRDISDASWTKSGCTVAPATADGTPAGESLAILVADRDGVPGSKIVENTGAVSPSLYRFYTYAAGVYTAWAIVAAGERHMFNIFSNGGALFNATFDLDAGTASGVGASITYLGNGEYLCAATVTATAGSANLQFRMFSNAGAASYTGDGTSGLFIKYAGLVAGTDVTAQNLLWGPAQFSSSLWTKSGVTITPSARTFGAFVDRVEYLEQNGADPSDAQPLAGRRWTALGSSITAQGAYTTPLAVSSGMTLTNAGYSGGSLGQATNGHYGSQKIYDSIATMPTDTEVCTLECGPNDFAAALVTLGSLIDTTISTFYGALYAAVVAIYARAPAARIVFVTPYGAGSGNPDYAMNATNGNGNTLRQFQKAIEDVGYLLGIPVVDVGRQAGIGYFSASVDTSDGLHINATGGTKHAKFDNTRLLEIHASGYFNF